MAPRVRCPSCHRLASPLVIDHIPVVELRALAVVMGTLVKVGVEFDQESEREGERPKVIDFIDALALSVNDALTHSMPAGQPSKKQKAA